MNSKFIRFFALLLAVCFCCCTVVQPMSASAAFDSSVCEFLYLYYSPFLVFDSDESATYFYESMFYGFLLESYTDSEIYELLEQVSADCIIGYDSVVVGESAVNLANDFSLFLMNYFDLADFNVGDVIEIGDDGALLYSAELPVYDLSGLFSPSKVELRLTDGPLYAAEHVLVSPVSDSMNVFLDSVGNAAVVAVGVGVVLFAGYALIRLIRRIL